MPTLETRDGQHLPTYTLQTYCDLKPRAFTPAVTMPASPLVGYRFSPSQIKAARQAFPGAPLREALELWVSEPQ